MTNEELKDAIAYAYECAQSYNGNSGYYSEQRDAQKLMLSHLKELCMVQLERAKR